MKLTSCVGPFSCDGSHSRVNWGTVLLGALRCECGKMGTMSGQGECMKETRAELLEISVFEVDLAFTRIFSKTCNFIFG